MSDKQYPIQPVVIASDGVHRFKENPIVRYLLDKGGIDMNHLAVQDFSDADREHFAQLIGYSVDGFGMLSYASDHVYDEAMKQREILTLADELDF